MTAPAIELANSAPAPALLGPQTVGILLRNILRTYYRHFGVLMACSLLPTLPFIILLKWMAATPWVLVVLLPYTVAAFIAGGALTVVISDICLGNRPTVGHAYRRGLMMEAGLLLLLLPGLWVIVRGFLTSIVVVLEDRKGMDAIKRSFALTKGQAWRIVGLMLLPLLLALIVLILCDMVVLVVGSFTLHDQAGLQLLIGTAGDVLGQLLFAPVIGITMVLLYYDQRVRREAYDVQALAEDLMR
jgi:hypothetical protein